MNKNKALLNFIFLYISLIFLAGTASAAIAINYPNANNLIVNGTSVFNFTINHTDAGGTMSTGEFINISLNASSTLTGNNTQVVIFRLVNYNLSSFSGGGVNTNVTFINVTGLEDSNNYIFNLTTNNDTVLQSVLLTGITLDSTTPTIPSSLVPSTNNVNISSRNALSFSSTIIDRTSTFCNLTVSRTGSLIISVGDDNYSSSRFQVNGSTCTITKAFTVPGKYLWAMSADDGTNVTTNSVQNILIINQPASGPPVIVPGQQIEEESDGNAIGNALSNIIKTIVDIIQNIISKITKR